MVAEPQKSPSLKRPHTNNGTRTTIATAARPWFGIIRHESATMGTIPQARKNAITTNPRSRPTDERLGLIKCQSPPHSETDHPRMSLYMASHQIPVETSGHTTTKGAGEVKRATPVRA